MDIATLKRAIEKLEKKVDFRCKKYTDRGCDSCSENETCKCEQITWNCDGTLTLFEESLKECEVIDTTPYIAYSQKHGGYCDCEVIFNVKEHIEHPREAPVRGG